MAATTVGIGVTAQGGGKGSGMTSMADAGGSRRDSYPIVIRPGADIHEGILYLILALPPAGTGTSIEAAPRCRPRYPNETSIR